MVLEHCMEWALTNIWGEYSEFEQIQENLKVGGIKCGRRNIVKKDLREEYLEFVMIQSAACVRGSLVLKTLLGKKEEKEWGDLNMCMSEVRCRLFKEMQQHCYGDVFKWEYDIFSRGSSIWYLGRSVIYNIMFMLGYNWVNSCYWVCSPS